MSLSPLRPAGQPRWDLIVYKALSSLYSETIKSRLGFAWWLLDPILYMSVFYVVFAIIFNRGGDDFVEKLLIALVLWRWFDNCVKTAGSSLLNGVGLMRQVYVPKLLFPLSSIIAQSLKSTIVLVILLLFLIASGIRPSASWLGLIPVLATELLFLAGVGLLLAAIIPFFPDLKILVEYGIQLAFFMSGVFYEISDIPEQLQPYFLLNPMASVIDQGRQVLLYQQLPDFALLGWIALASAALLALGAWLLARYDRDYPNMLLL